MKLDVVERIALQSVLPEVGNFTNLKLVREVKEKLSFTEAEHKKYKFNESIPGSVRWDNTLSAKEYFAEIDLGDIVVELIKTALKKLDSEEKLEDKHFSLYEKFVED